MASHRVSWRQAFPESCRGGAVSIGNFDGAHRGHAALIDETVRQARAAAGPAVALTFDPHPGALLRPDRPPALLTTADDRAAFLRRMGADEVITLEATADLLDLPATEFFTRVLRDRLAARAVVEGANFGFGRGREGTVELLARLCRDAGIGLSVVEPVWLDGAAVSSSRIRDELRRGDVAAAAALLGRPYRLHGTVGTGQRRGRTIGFPTANLTGVATVVPAEGVYAVVARTPDGALWPGAANVGRNPTFAEAQHKIEVYLIGFQGDLYGAALAVDFLTRLRATRAFAGVSELVEQMSRDVVAAERLGRQAIAAETGQAEITQSPRESS